MSRNSSSIGELEALILILLYLACVNGMIVRKGKVEIGNSGLGGLFPAAFSAEESYSLSLLEELVAYTIPLATNVHAKT